MKKKPELSEGLNDLHERVSATISRIIDIMEEERCSHYEVILIIKLLDEIRMTDRIQKNMKTDEKA